MANGYAKYGGLGGGGGGGSGTVTSVGLADGSTTPIFTITGSPVTTTGTLTETLKTQTANTVFAGPTTGAAAQPTFRALVSADLPFVFGNLTDAGTDGIVITGGTGAVVGSGTSIAQHVADTTHNGYLSSTDWNTFNGKGSGSVTSVAMTVPTFLSVSGSPVTTSGTLAVSLSGTALPVANGGTSLTTLTLNNVILGNGTSAPTFVAPGSSGNVLKSNGTTWTSAADPGINAITALTGDGTATGPGSVAFTLATVNSNVGSFGSSTSIPTFTVNGKGLITAASGNVVIAPAGTLTGTTLASNVVTSSLTTVGTIGTGTWQGTKVAVPFGGTNATSFTAFSVICGGTTSTGALQNVSGLGSSGFVLTSGGAGVLPTWANPAAYSGGAFFASSQVTTDSTAVSSGTFTTFSNSPAFSFTPSVNGTYRIWSSLNCQTNTNGILCSTRIFNTTGGATLLYESQGEIYNGAGAPAQTTYTESVYTLTAGVAYVFDIQAKVISGSGSILTNGAEAPFYIFAEGVVTGTGALTLATFGSTPNSSGASLAASTLTLQPASASQPGGVSTIAQAFAGDKTFNDKVIIPTASTQALTLNNTGFVFDSTNNALGIGTAPDTTTFIDGVNSTAAAKRFVLTGYGVGSTVGTRGRFARNTSVAPAAAQNGDILNFLSGQGYGTSQFPAASTGSISFIAGETFTNTSNATYVTISTTPTTSVTAAERMRINSTGNVLIGTTTDSGTQKLQVSGNSNVGTVTAGVWNGTNTSGSAFFTAGTTFTTDSTVTAATLFDITLIGGGGAGGGTPTTANFRGSGGGSGGVCIVKGLSGLAASTGYTFSIGAGGTGNSNATGGSGGGTSITINAVTYTGGGGGGGLVGPSQLGGAGGTTTNATIGLTGQNGGSIGATVANLPGSIGGSCQWGPGGLNQFAPGTGSSNGLNATGFGGGGGGGCTAASTGTVSTGGNGSGGAVIINWRN